MGPRTVTQDANLVRAGHSAGRAVARLARAVELALAPLELSMSQYRMLGFLAAGAAGSSSLAERLTVSPPSVTAVVDGMVTRGLVVRSADPTDRRRLTVELTDAGRRALVDADAAVEARLTEIADAVAPGSSAVQQLEGWNERLDTLRGRKRRESGTAR